MRKDIKQTIKTIRKEQGLTQANMADRLNMARSTYSKLESGNTSVNIDTLKNISKVLDVPINQIITADEDKVALDLSSELSLMLSQTEYRLSDKLIKVIPYEKLTANHLELLKSKGFKTREDYENTPLGGRVYEFSPKDVFRYMVENCCMDVLFRRKLITDKYWLNIWNDYLMANAKTKTDEISSLRIKNNDDVIIDEMDYFFVVIISLQFSGGKEKLVQIAEREFPDGYDEFMVLEHLKTKTNALDAEIMCFSEQGYDPVSEIMHW